MSSIELNNPFVSVVLPTYNHVQFIRNCIEGIVTQKTNFKFEVIIGEDDSDDGTKSICMDYSKRYPDLIKVIQRSRKDVISIHGKATGRFNYIESLKVATGKYIALCDGDDYWTDPLKLQKQVDYLESHKDVVLCFHPVKVLKGEELVDDFITKEYDAITDRKHLVSFGNYIHTPSVMFRNLIKEFPSAMYKAPAADYLLYVLLTEHGNIARLDDTMAVYRHGTGLFSTLKREQMLNSTIRTYRSILELLSGELKSIMKKRIQDLMKLKAEMMEVDLKSDELKREILDSPEFVVKHVRFKNLIKSIFRKLVSSK